MYRSSATYGILARMSSSEPKSIEHEPPHVEWMVSDEVQIDTGPATATRRRLLMPLVLFVLTCLSTFWAGACRGGTFTPFALLAGPEAIAEIVSDGWRDGLQYMGAVMAILLAHELGHFVQAVRYQVPASFPLFIPMPLTPLGTMGAVIALRGSKADRREIFDIGLTGPWAGLLVALPIAWLGVSRAVPAGAGELFPDDLVFNYPLVMHWMFEWLHPGVPNHAVYGFDPVLRAAWLGMLVTGLNMMPVSQLDGGHVAYALFGRKAHLLARWFMVLALTLVLYGYIVYGQITWLVMLILVSMMGIDHPPTANDAAPLGLARRIIGLLSLAIPVLCFTPMPVR